ncbi:FAD-binding oxidoreductase [Microcoleus sp. CAWBG58]|uniref:NAD(P)/FAD-dependent oxidoreductase n=1 Tax=Microcoleus sp. CAWBG58 TaxID=2841651 RepID=UPI0025CD8F26|nr:FAD-dependent oxidoreductase [Microcoleus sp. CAWBG58]
MKRKAIVLGAGIKGTAIAVLLSLTDEFEIRLVDQDKVASGTTSTNHGRLHLGTSGWRTETDDLIRRRMLGSSLMRQLPAIATCLSEGHYCVEREEELVAFISKCDANQIPYRVLSSNEIENEWINIDQFSTVVQVPEFSFNPARVAGRFAQSFENQGGVFLPNQRAIRVHRKDRTVFLELENGNSLEADVIINASTRWCNTVTITDCNPLFTVEWFRWRLLCLRSQGFIPLKQVTVIVEPTKKAPSAIPHEQWITIDCKTDLEKLDSPEGEQNAGWRPIDLNNRIDYELYSTGYNYFQPLRQLRQLSDSELQNQLFSMSGVHGRLVGDPPGSVNKVYSTDSCPNYFLTFGGQASTAVLDAIETIEHLAKLGVCGEVNRGHLIQQLAHSLAVEPLPNSTGMIWEQQEAA